MRQLCLFHIFQRLTDFRISPLRIPRRPPAGPFPSPANPPCDGLAHGTRPISRSLLEITLGKVLTPWPPNTRYSRCPAGNKKPASLTDGMFCFRRAPALPRSGYNCSPGSLALCPLASNYEPYELLGCSRSTCSRSWLHEDDEPYSSGSKGRGTFHTIQTPRGVI